MAKASDSLPPDKASTKAAFNDALDREQRKTGWSELSFAGKTGILPLPWWEVPKTEGKNAGSAECALGTKYALEFIGYLHGHKHLQMEPGGDFPDLVEAMTGVQLDYVQRVFLDTIATYISGQDIVVAYGGSSVPGGTSWFLAQREGQQEGEK